MKKSSIIKTEVHKVGVRFICFHNSYISLLLLLLLPISYLFQELQNTGLGILLHTRIIKDGTNSAIAAILWS